jgi:putative ATP-dependent endonuclease of OLD family
MPLPHTIVPTSGAFLTTTTIHAAASSEPVPVQPMRVSRMEVENFRLLRKVDVAFDRETTVLVGRNNTGKTSLAEVVSRFLEPKTLKLTIADFSSEVYDEFLASSALYLARDEEAARQAMPSIRLRVTIAYDPASPEYGPLGALIVDLDPLCATAIVEFIYSLRGGLLAEFFEGSEVLASEGLLDTTALMKLVGGRVPEMFERTLAAIDPNDPGNTRAVPLESVRRLISVDFLKAQRGADDEKERPGDPIGALFESLFLAASEAGGAASRRETADNLRLAVSSIEATLAAEIDTMVSGVIPTLEKFGYPGIGNQSLATQTRLDVEKILSNYTSIRYEGVSGVSLPESYSGLGSRNLVLILLTLLSYYRAFAARQGTPGVHLIFVEEPEAHLHPQMQEVFIHQLSRLKTLFPEIDGVPGPWSAQFVVSTHSSHVANRAPFSAIRYFRLESTDPKAAQRHSRVLDLTKADLLDEKFLHQYLTLTRSDLFFADKAILVEGTSERLIVPKVIDDWNPHDGAGLSSQYVTILEVGGAYAHKFFPLLDFLGLPSLIITDLDSVAGDKRKSAPVHGGEQTSNATINRWFPDAKLSPTDLIAEAELDSIIKINRYLAYQVPESSGQACGRTFEDAFILANPALFDLTSGTNLVETEKSAAAIASTYKKSDFALKFSISETEWLTPRYIRKGLEWLLAYTDPAELTPEDTKEAVVTVK